MPKPLPIEFVHDRDGVTVRAGGPAMQYAQINKQNLEDLLLMEAIAIPLTFLVLVWVFGGLLAAALPMALGALAVAGSMTVLRLITFATDVSIFALNLSAALGLALAVDYTLLILSRYRDELAEGSDRRAGADSHHGHIRPHGAVLRGHRGAVDVGDGVVPDVLPEVVRLRRCRDGGLRRDCVDRGDAGRDRAAGPADRRVGRAPAVAAGAEPAEPVHKPVDQLFWYRSSKFVMRRWLPIGLAGIALLLLLGLPFMSVKWGFPDDRVLPLSSSSHQVGDRLRTGFAHDSARAVPIVVPDARGLTSADLDSYAADLSRVPDVSSVTDPTGRSSAETRWDHRRRQPGWSDGSALLTVGSTAPLFSHGERYPARSVARGARPGWPSRRDSVASPKSTATASNAVTDRLPLVLGLMAAITFVLLFMLTGSVVLPAKALVCNVLSLTAAFGALVWIFQDGHLGALGTTPSGTLVANMPVLLFCIAFGLSMDYEVFLISRIREYWLASGAARPAKLSSQEAHAANDESVALRRGPHRPGDHGRCFGDVDVVRRADRRPCVVHANVRPRPHAGGGGGCHPGADGPGAGVHACDGPVELVGAQAAGVDS